MIGRQAIETAALFLLGPQAPQDGGMDDRVGQRRNIRGMSEPAAEPDLSRLAPVERVVIAELQRTRPDLPRTPAWIALCLVRSGS
jgi:hypothetical protein